MLYDPNWEQKTKAQPSLTGLIAWLETQNPDGDYNWGSCEGECLMHRYFISLGIPKAKWHEFYLPCQGWSKDHGAPRDSNGDAISIALNEPHTFGAALERARKVAAVD